MAIDVKVSRINRFNGETKYLKAFVDIAVNDSLIVKGLQVMSGKKGIFVSMPRQKGKDERWYEIVRPLTKDVKNAISDVVLAAYNESEKLNNKTAGPQ